MSRVVHFEIPAENAARAAEFYRATFGWKINKWEGPIDYWLAETGTEGEPVIDGAIYTRDEGDQIRNVIDVESVDEAVKSIESAGGVIISPKMAVPGIGYTAYFQDTEGNILGVIENDESAA